MQLEPATTGDASSLLSGFYFDQGNKQLAEVFRKRASEYFEQQRKEQEEAVNFSVNDRFIPHGLDEKAVKELQHQLRKVHGLEAPFLVRKGLGSSDSSIYVLAALAGFTWREGRNDKHIGPLFEELVAIRSLPAPLVFISLDGEHSNLLPKLAEIDGAQLFPTADAKVIDQR